jgi:flagellar hook-length control protein FliK
MPRPRPAAAPSLQDFTSLLAAAKTASGPATILPALPIAPGQAGPLLRPLPAAAPAAVPGVSIAGLAVEIAARAREGGRVFDIRLDPPELGRIAVRIEVNHDGTVASRLVVDRSETLDLLRREAPALERALESAGLKTAAGGLDFSLRHQDSAGRNNAGQDREAPPLHLLVADEEAAATPALSHGHGRPGSLGAGIDIRV